MSCPQVIARYSGGNVMRNVYVDIMAKNFYPVKQKSRILSICKIVFLYSYILKLTESALKVSQVSVHSIYNPQLKQLFLDIKFRQVEVLPTRKITVNSPVQLGLGSIPFIRGFKGYMRRGVVNHCESAHLQH